MAGRMRAFDNQDPGDDDLEATGEYPDYAAMHDDREEQDADFHRFENRYGD